MLEVPYSLAMRNSTARRRRFEIGVVTCIVAGGIAAAAPRVEPTASEVSVGDLVRGATAEAVFTLRNTGDETLRILGADPG